MSSFPSTLALFCALAPATLAAQEPVAPPQPPPTVHDIQITGAKELSAQAILDELPARVDEPFATTTDQIVHAVEHQYRDEGFTFARAKADFDAASGVLKISIEEGVIDGVEFEGVDDKLAQTFAAEFALHAGDVFNSRKARQALNALLRPTRGAIMAGRVAESSSVFTDTRQLGNAGRRTFDLVEVDGKRILRIGLREPAGRFKLRPTLGGREDWFTSVDGIVPSLDFGAAVFEHQKFNHAFIAGHLSVKGASRNVGYALGFERPFFVQPQLYLGAEVFDLTASDDLWQISSSEAGLAAIGPRRSYRDYYRRRGGQFNAALRPESHIELLFGLRTERQESLAVTSDFSFWNDDEPFAPNIVATEGRLNAFELGASVSSRRFDRESLETSYRRHQLESFFGMNLEDPRRPREDYHIWRIDWTSELSAPGALDSDFDFRRHIISGRVRAEVSDHQEVGARVIGGWSQGVLPPQRLFGIGGIGSVHGYPFKVSVGDTMALMNVEYAVGWRSGPQLWAFLDAGRTTSRTATATTPSPTDGEWLRGIGWGIGLGTFRIDFGYKLAKESGPVQVLVRFARTF
jgi:outer membrane protein insertion porin family